MALFQGGGQPFNAPLAGTPYSNQPGPAYRPNPTGQPSLAQPTPNVYGTSSRAYNDAVGATQGAMVNNALARPMMGQASGYNAFTGLDESGESLAGFGAGQASGGGYTAAQSGPARDVTAGQFAGLDIAPYMNPYTDNVVNQTAQDMERARLIEQNQANDAMQAAGAFGGSRHGIANAETNRGFYDRLGATTGQLRNMGYQNAQAAAFQDIGNRMAGDMANQQADLSTGQFNAGQTNQARMTGANNALAASLANAQAQSQLSAQRMGALNDAGRFNAGAMNDMSRFNSGAYNQFQQQQFGNQMGGAQQLAGLSSQGLAMGNNIADRQAADGAKAREIQQQLMDLAQQQWAGYTGVGNLGLAALQSGIASVPGGGEVSTSKENPGIAGILSGLSGFR